MSGYTPCKCETCFNVAVSDDVSKPDYCNECDDANCEDHDTCQVDDFLDDLFDPSLTAE